MIDHATFVQIVESARFAPSAHNTQPARWRLGEDGSILIAADMTRRLPICDPDDRDLKVAIGAAVEGTVLALSQRGFGATVTYLSKAEDGGLKPMVRIGVTGNADDADVALAAQVPHRRTHRAGFASSKGAAPKLSASRSTKVVSEAADIDWLAARIDTSSARIMRNGAFRSELLAWMRLNPNDPRYHQDGLSRDTMAMSPMTAALTRPVLGTALYPLLAALGLGPSLSSEASRSKTASAIILFHWPDGANMFDAGPMFYRSWLEVTAAGLAGWPAASLADDPETAAQVKERFQLPAGRVAFNALRVGRASRETPDNARLETKHLMF